MSDVFETHASGVHGGMHAGTGDINHAYYLPQADTPGTSPRKQPMDELRWLERRFVAPAGLGRARDVLEKSRTVFLDGLPGSGRIAAAKTLLWELRDGEREIHELLPQENAPRINLGHIGDGDLTWLDLSQAAGARWDEVHDELSSLRATVHDRDARLVVVLPDATGHLGSTLARYRVGIRRPPVDEVLSRYLLVEDIPRPVRFPRLRFLDADRRMEEVPRYVALIRSAREDHRDGAFMTWCEDAYQALFGQTEGVAAQLSELPAGRQRALLLAVAMLHEAHADVVHRAGIDLLDTVAHPPGDSPLLEHAPLGQRLEEIGAEVDSSGSVRFTKLDYDAAVRSYFWVHMPQLRDALESWMMRTADSSGLSAHDRTNLVERFTEQCLTARYRPTLVALVEQWTAQSTTIPRMEAAAAVVRRGLRDEEQGRHFRRQIYEWSRRDDLSDRLAEVIIAACRDEMMARHPDEALVRLHHVARRERGTRAWETLVALVGDALRFRRQMLTRLTDSPGRWHRDIDLFLELADPQALTDRGRRDHALIAESTVREQLVTGWSVVFARRPYEVWAPRVRQWLQVATVAERHRRALLAILVRGGEEDARVLARLYAMTREREAWTSLGDLVVRNIDAVWEARTA